MNQEIRDEWTRRLRSGEYPQGRGALNRDGQFCCLGVLCEMAAERGITLRHDLRASGVAYGQPEDLNLGGLPGEVIEWAGLPLHHRAGSRTVYIENTGNGPATLASLNDTGHTFSQIADIIEERL